MGKSCVAGYCDIGYCYKFPECGNGKCEANETSLTCPADCAECYTDTAYPLKDNLKGKCVDYVCEYTPCTSNEDCASRCCDVLIDGRGECVTGIYPSDPKYVCVSP